MSGWETFLNVFSPRLSSTKRFLIRSAVTGPTAMSPPWAEAARRAATLVVGPVAVNVQRWEPAPPSLVAPRSASPVLMPMWSSMAGNTPAYSSFSSRVRCRIAKAARVAFRAWSSATPSGRVRLSCWKITMSPSPAVSFTSPWCARMISRKLEK